MKDTLKKNLYYDLKGLNMNKRKAVNYRVKSMTRGIQTMLDRRI